ncbi:MAG: hypothetical protein CMI15_14775 [Opitutaceae bacterium]|nr:hypothetical protein [Opitutaceae bacterium]
MNLIEIRLLDSEALEKIYQIDRSGEIHRRYQFSNGDLSYTKEDLSIPHNPAFWDQYFDEWKTAIDKGAAFYGAMDEEGLSGFTILKHDLQPGVAQIMALYVDSAHRMSGIARSLFLEAQDAARANGASTLYVSATPTDAAVGFYLHQGFQPTTDPVPALLEKEPENIHMVKRL